LKGENSGGAEEDGRGSGGEDEKKGRRGTSGTIGWDNEREATERIGGGPDEEEEVFLFLCLGGDGEGDREEE
jgi:hypothetical protein